MAAARRGWCDNRGGVPTWLQGWFLWAATPVPAPVR